MSLLLSELPHNGANRQRLHWRTEGTSVNRRVVRERRQRAHLGPYRVSASWHSMHCSVVVKTGALKSAQILGLLSASRSCEIFGNASSAARSPCSVQEDKVKTFLLPGRSRRAESIILLALQNWTSKSRKAPTANARIAIMRSSGWSNPPQNSRGASRIRMVREARKTGELLRKFTSVKRNRIVFDN